MTPTFSARRGHNSTRGMDLYEWQRECIDLGKTGTSVIVRAPTSAGKSRVCDAILMHRLKQLGGVALVVLPFVALCDERSEQIAVGLTGTDIRLVRMYGGQGGALHNWQRDTIVVCTPERANQFLTQAIELKRSRKIVFAVIDETHMLRDRQRGGAMQGILTKLRMCESEAQVLCMSATMKDRFMAALATWLGAETYSTTFRPVRLRVYVKRGNVLYVDETPSRELSGARDIDHIAQLTNETIEMGGSVLVFCQSKISCETTARALRPLITTASKIGVHNSDLSSSDRVDMEEAFRAGSVRVICCTSTLAMGVNLPARRVIIRGVHRNTSDGMIQQMIGRAGRAGLDAEGDAIIFDEHCQYTTTPDDDRVHMHESAATRLVVETVASGLVKTSNDVHRLIDCAFASDARSRIHDAVKWCRENGLIAWNETSETWSATKLGSGLSSSTLSPELVSPLLRRIQRLQRGAVLSSALQVIYLLVPERVGGDVCVTPRELVCDMCEEDAEAARRIGVRPFDARFVYAVALNDIIEERSTEHKFGVSVGDIEQARDACIRTGMDLCVVCESIGYGTVASVIGRITNRLISGSKESTLELTRIPHIGALRARYLARHGIRTPEDILNLGSVDALFAILKKMSRNVTDGILIKSASNIFTAVGKMLEEKAQDISDLIVAGGKRKYPEIT